MKTKNKETEAYYKRKSSNHKRKNKKKKNKKTIKTIGKQGLKW